MQSRKTSATRRARFRINITRYVIFSRFYFGIRNCHTLNPFLTNSGVCWNMTMALAPSSSEQSALGGMALAATAFALMTSVDTIFKLMAENHPAHQILLVNAAFALLPVFLWARMTGGFTARLGTTRPLWHMSRGTISVLSAFAAIYAYSRLPLTDFYAIVFTGPLIVTAMSAVWLNEKVERERWLAIAGGFLGVLVVANPFESVVQGTAMMEGRLAAFISIFFYALSVIMVRRMRLSETNLTFGFYGYCACLAICTVLIFMRGGPELSAEDIGHLALSGTLAGISTICLMTAWHRTPVSLVAPFQYTQIIPWGAAGGLCSALVACAGCARDPRRMLIVAGCGLFVIYREMRGKDVP